jgi:hypothetical protein
VNCFAAAKFDNFRLADDTSGMPDGFVQALLACYVAAWRAMKNDP